MAVVAVPFILYLVRFCSSKSCTRKEYVLYIRPLGAVYGWIRLARTRPSRRRGRVRAGRIRPYTATRGLI